MRHRAGILETRKCLWMKSVKGEEGKQKEEEFAFLTAEKLKSKASTFFAQLLSHWHHNLESEACDLNIPCAVSM